MESERNASVAAGGDPGTRGGAPPIAKARTCAITRSPGFSFSPGSRFGAGRRPMLVTNARLVTGSNATPCTPARPS